MDAGAHLGNVNLAGPAGEDRTRGQFLHKAEEGVDALGLEFEGVLVFSAQGQETRFLHDGMITHDFRRSRGRGPHGLLCIGGILGVQGVIGRTEGLVLDPAPVVQAHVVQLRACRRRGFGLYRIFFHGRNRPYIHVIIGERDFNRLGEVQFIAGHVVGKANGSLGIAYAFQLKLGQIGPLGKGDRHRERGLVDGRGNLPHHLEIGNFGQYFFGYQIVLQRSAGHDSHQGGQDKDVLLHGRLKMKDKT